MTFVLVFLCLALFTVAALLARQVGLTREADEERAEWKRRFEQLYRERAARPGRRRETETREENAALGPASVPRRSVAGPSGTGKTARPARAVAARTTAGPPSGALTLALPIQLLSKNVRDKLHYRARHRLRRDYVAIIGLAYPRRGEPPRIKQRVTVTRVLGPRERPFDGQNVGAGSAVELIDALTACGYWVDDAPRWLETAFKQGDRPGVEGPAVVVEIEPLA